MKPGSDVNTGEILKDDVIADAKFVDLSDSHTTDIYMTTERVLLTVKNGTVSPLEHETVVIDGIYYVVTKVVNNPAKETVTYRLTEI